MELVNRLFGTEPLILHASGPLHLSPLWDGLQSTLFGAEPPAAVPAPRDYTFFVWNSGAQRSHDRAKRLGTAERCLRRLRVPSRCLVEGSTRGRTS
ncbi:MAG TPA: hypothetical protein VK988_05620 [Acidimicrobiales bacterium]|nr:hypothetical protein [Acidimicrobiales bacterium]